MNSPSESWRRTLTSTGVVTLAAKKTNSRVTAPSPKLALASFSKVISVDALAAKKANSRVTAPSTKLALASFSKVVSVDTLAATKANSRVTAPSPKPPLATFSKVVVAVDSWSIWSQPAASISPTLGRERETKRESVKNRVKTSKNFFEVGLKCFHFFIF